MTAQLDDAAADHRELNFLPLGQVVGRVVQKLEARELRVGPQTESDSRNDAAADNQPICLAHDVSPLPAGRETAANVSSTGAVSPSPPIELVPASICAAGSGALAGEAAIDGCRAWCGLLIVRRPLKLRIWRW